jgi:hypothetical protein
MLSTSSVTSCMVTRFIEFIVQWLPKHLYRKTFGSLFDLTRMKTKYVLHLTLLFGIRLKSKWSVTKLIYQNRHIQYSISFFKQPKGEEAHRTRVAVRTRAKPGNWRKLGSGAKASKRATAPSW